MSRLGVTVAEVIEAVRQRRALMAPETAGYLVLAAADQLASAPVGVDAQRCTVVVDGGRVVIGADAPRATDLDAERGLRTMLSRLLSVASGGAPALQAVASLAPRGAVAALVTELESALIPVNRAAAARALARLARETERAQGDLRAVAAERSTGPEQPNGADPAADAEEHDTEPIEVPVRRVPAVRASVSPSASSSGAPFAPFGVAELDGRQHTDEAAVDDLLAVRTEPPAPVRVPAVPDLELPGELAGRWGPRGASAAPQPAPLSQLQSARSVDELLEGFMAVDPKHEARLAEDLRHIAGVDELALAAPPSGATPFETMGAAELNHRTPPLPGGLTSSPATAKVGSRATSHATHPAGQRGPAVAGDEPRARRRSVWLLLLLVVLLGAAASFLWMNEPGFLAGRGREARHAEQRLADAVRSAVAEQQACLATLVVTDVPPGAEVLVGAGAAPVDVERVPSGAPLEFVAVADGYAPRRGTVPLGTAWDTSSGKPRFELAIQLDRSRAKPAALDPWPAATSGSTVGGQGSPGTVRVVTTPKGAEVWMVVGGSPEARIEALPCGTSIELLVAGASAGQPYRRRLHVDSGKTTPSASANAIVARVSAGN